MEGKGKVICINYLESSWLTIPGGFVHFRDSPSQKRTVAGRHPTVPLLTWELPYG